ncbi:MAG: gamma-glutamyltransferase [Chloroflexia bacterium]|nr:gamma-glutamyltransferase [Chloroflexia bacterium]
MASTRPTTLATHGMVATPHYLASTAGLRVLEEGGSAMDAVIAANAILTVLYPDQTAIGGDCFFMVFDAGTGDTVGYNGSGRAAMAADAAALVAQGYEAMPPKGGTTVTVPGTIDAWISGHERFGHLDLARLLAPAIDLARDGFPVSPRLASVLAARESLIREWPALRAHLSARGSVPAAGSLLAMPQLASTLQTIASGGRAAFYDGPIAEAIATSVQDSGGWLSTGDLASHAGEWVTPIARDYRGVTVQTMPPNSQGITALLGLGMVEGEPPTSIRGSARQVHPWIEAAKLAYAVRDARIGDPAFVDIDTAQLLSRESLDDLWRSYDPDRAGPGRPNVAGDTVYICAVDRDGSAVSLIQSLFGAFGSCVVAGNTGIVLQNRGSSFSLDPGSINLLEPGKRTLHTLMPSMLLRHGALHGSIGTQGGDAQAQIQMQLIANLVDFGMEPQEAIEAPRWIADGTDGGRGVTVEQGFPEGTIAGLATRGHEMTLVDGWNPNAGHAQMILIDPQTAVLKGGADPRADGAALGY